MAFRSFTGFLRCERGGGTIMGLLWFILLVGITGLAVDITDALRNQTMLQATADAASHAAVQDLFLAAVVGLPDEDAAVASAVASALIYADKNMAFAENGVVLRAPDVQVGVWNPLTRVLMVDTGLTPNAVQVTLRRTSANGNALPLNFLSIAGVLGTDDLNDWDIVVQSVAMAGVDSCLTDGFIATEKILSGSTNEYLAPICIHGQDGVKIGSTNTFQLGVNVTMFKPDDTFIQSQDNYQIEYALGERDWVPPLPGVVSSIVAGLINQTLAPPDYITDDRPVRAREFLPDNPSTDFFYVITEKVDFGSDADIDGLAVVSLKEIDIGSNSTMTNTFLGSWGNITLGSDSNFSNVTLAAGDMIKASSYNRYGSDTYCPGRNGEVNMYAVNNIELESNSEYTGAQIVSGQTVKLGSNLVSLIGVSVQAGKDIEWGSAELYGVCGAPLNYNPTTAVYLVN